MFKRSVIAILATAGAASIALTAYMLWKKNQEVKEEAVPEQEPEDEVVRFVDITNDNQSEDKGTGFGLRAEDVLDQAEETAEKAADDALYHAGGFSDRNAPQPTWPGGVDQLRLFAGPSFLRAVGKRYSYHCAPH